MVSGVKMIALVNWRASLCQNDRKENTGQNEEGMGGAWVSESEGGGEDKSKSTDINVWCCSIISLTMIYRISINRACTFVYTSSIWPLHEEALTRPWSSPEVAPKLRSAPCINQKPCGQERTAGSLVGSADVAGKALAHSFFFCALLQGHWCYHLQIFYSPSSSFFSWPFPFTICSLLHFISPESTQSSKATSFNRDGNKWLLNKNIHASRILGLSLGY